MIRRLFSLAIAGAVTVACVAHPTTGDFGRNLLRAYCQRSAECSGSDPSTVDTCIKITSSIAGKDLSDTAQESCDVDEANKCIVDTRAMSCDELKPASGRLFARSCDGC